MEVQRFPLDTQIGNFNNESQVEAWLLTQDDSKVMSIDYMTFIKHSSLIYTPEINEYIMRYNLLKNHNIHSYGNVLDDLPAKWVDVLNLLESEYHKATAAKRGN